MIEQTYGIIVYRRRQSIEFLLIKKRRGGWWSLPKGHAEQGESPVRTAVRETREETGIIAKVVSSWHTSIVFPLSGGKRKRVTFFLGERHKGKVGMADAEVSAAAWFPYELALKKLKYPQTRQALRDAHRVIGASGNRQAADRAIPHASQDRN